MKTLDIVLATSVAAMGGLFWLRKKAEDDAYANRTQDALQDEWKERVLELQALLAETQRILSSANIDLNELRQKEDKAMDILGDIYMRWLALKEKLPNLTAGERSEYNSLSIALSAAGVNVK